MARATGYLSWINERRIDRTALAPTDRDHGSDCMCPSQGSSCR